MTGQNIIPESLKTRTGEPMQVSRETISFSDENPTEKFQQLAISTAGKKVYLSGTLAVDYPEGITLQPPGRQYQTATLTSDRLTFDMHSLELATVQLSDQCVTGSLSVMVF